MFSVLGYIVWLLTQIYRYIETQSIAERGQPANILSSQIKTGGRHHATMSPSPSLLYSTGDRCTKKIRAKRKQASRTVPKWPKSLVHAIVISPFPHQTLYTMYCCSGARSLCFFPFFVPFDPNLFAIASVRDVSLLVISLAGLKSPEALHVCSAGTRSE